MSYTVQRRLGRGGMGVVDLAIDGTGRAVAVKRIALHGSFEQMDRARVRAEREVQALRRLRHPAIVSLLDASVDHDGVVLVLPYLSGGSLADRVARHGVLTSGQTRALARVLVDAVAHAHAQGVVHRDIKPANILFDSSGNPFLVDFGVADLRGATAGLTVSGQLIGTPDFMSPEQARGDATTPSTDVFSLGATLRFALTGLGPWGHGDPRVVVARAARGRADRLPGTVDADLVRLLDAVLDRRPERRPSAADLARQIDPTWAPASVGVSHAVTQVASGDPGPRHPPATGRSWNRRGPLVGVGVLLSVGLLATAATRWPDRSPAVAEAVEAPGPSTVACTDLPYQPCGDPVAPFTDGRQCLDDHADFDGDASNGCEAAPDDVDGTLLRTSLTANLVPADDIDRYPIRVVDNFHLLCDGRLEVSLTASASETLRLDVLREGELLDSATTSGSRSARIVLHEPSCLGDDSTTLQARVTRVGDTPTADPYTITVRGSY